MILCGYSYGGMVIIGVVDYVFCCICRLVYFDVVILYDGEVLIDILLGLFVVVGRDLWVVDGVELVFWFEMLFLVVYGFIWFEDIVFVEGRLILYFWKMMIELLGMYDLVVVVVILCVIINCVGILVMCFEVICSCWLMGDLVWLIDIGYDLMIIELQQVVNMLLKLVQ